MLPVYCCACKGLGHLGKDCPKENFEVEAMSPPSNKNCGILSDVCQIIMMGFTPSVADSNLRLNHLERLQKFIRAEYPGRYC